jgi:hypothetical protein
MTAAFTYSVCTFGMLSPCVRGGCSRLHTVTKRSAS